jgi:hypothetical protein
LKSKEDFDESTIEQLLNGEETDFLKNEKNKEKEDDNDDYMDEDFIHIESEEIKQLIEDSSPVDEEKNNNNPFSNKYSSNLTDS